MWENLCRVSKWGIKVSACFKRGACQLGEQQPPAPTPFQCWNQRWGLGGGLHQSISVTFYETNNSQQARPLHAADGAREKQLDCVCTTECNSVMSSSFRLFAHSFRLKIDLLLTLSCLMCTGTHRGCHTSERNALCLHDAIPTWTVGAVYLLLSRHPGLKDLTYPLWWPCYWGDHRLTSASVAIFFSRMQNVNLILQ